MGGKSTFYQPGSVEYIQHERDKSTEGNRLSDRHSVFAGNAAFGQPGLGFQQPLVIYIWI
jgi:hypothetical protein